MNLRLFFDEFQVDDTFASVHFDHVKTGGQRSDIEFGVIGTHHQTASHVVNLHIFRHSAQTDDAADALGRVRGNVHFGIEFVVDDTHAGGQVERNHAVATSNGGQRLGVVTGFAIENVVPLVAAVGCLDGEFANGAEVDGQGHGDHRVATVHRLQGDALRAGSREFDTVPGVRQLTFADGGFVGDSVSRVHRQGHSDHRVAARSSGQGDILRAGSREFNTVPSVRQFALADGGSVSDSVGRVNCQVKNDDTVAAGRSL